MVLKSMAFFEKRNISKNIVEVISCRMALGDELSSNSAYLAANLTLGFACWKSEEDSIPPKANAHV